MLKLAGINSKIMCVASKYLSEKYYPRTLN